MTTRHTVALFLAAWAILGGVAAYRTPATWAGEWDHETTLLVTNSVYRKVHWGWSASMGYPPGWQDERKGAWYSESEGSDYAKQFGLPVFVLAALAPHDLDTMERYLLGARYVAAALSSACAALLVTLFGRRCGLLTAAALVAFVAAEPWYGSFLHSLYWQPGLSLLPLVAVLALYSPERPLRGALSLYAACVYLRALCGYEHVSVLVLTASAGVVFNGRPAAWRLLARHGTYFVLAGGVAVSLAILTHFASVWIMQGSLDAALANTLGNAVHRSFGKPDYLLWASTPKAHALGVYGTLAQWKMVTALLGLWGLAFAAWALRPARFGPDVATLAVASLLALFAAASWLVLMRVHIAMAPRYNGLLYFHGFAWFAIAFLIAFARSFREGAPHAP